MAKPSGFNPPIIILGMHRSGTSLVAGMLHKMGVSMGSSFLSSDKFNPLGYFEDLDFLGINKGILENAGGSWKKPPTIDDMLGKSKKFRNIIHETIHKKQSIAGKRKWGWKDPRNCLTCWIYAPHARDAKYIVVVRDFNGIKQSLINAHGNTEDWNFLIKTYYDSVDSFLLSHKNESINVIFDKLVSKNHSRDSVADIINFVGLSEKKMKIAVRAIQLR